jgi:hypothetical protein
VDNATEDVTAVIVPRSGALTRWGPGLGLFQKVLVWWSAENVSGDKRHGVAIEWAELDVIGASIDQLGFRLSYGGTRWPQISPGP